MDIAIDCAAPQFGNSDDHAQNQRQKCKTYEQAFQFEAATNAKRVLPLVEAFLIEAKQDALLAEGQCRRRDLLELGGKRVELLALLAELSCVGGVGRLRQIVATTSKRFELVYERSAKFFGRAR